MRMIQPHRMLNLLHKALSLLLLLLLMAMPSILLLVNIPLTTPSRMKVLIALAGCSGRAFWDDFFGGDDGVLLGSAWGAARDVAGAAAAGGGRGAVAFADDFAVDVDGGVGADVAGAWSAGSA